MTVAQALQQFYTDNNLANDGGESETTFELKFKLFTLKLPNSQFRKEVIHIHDIQHILYNCDTTWKGESFIAGWEIATGLWKHLPIGFMSLWAMGFSLLNYPKEVFKGYKAGLQCKGIIDLKMPKEVLLNLSLHQLKSFIKKDETKRLDWFQFLFWSFLSIFIVLFPFLLIIVGIAYLI